MLFKNYFNHLVLLPLLFLLSQTVIASVIEAKCGDYLFQVEILNGKDPFERQFELFYKEKNQKKKLFYKTDSGIDLIAACLQNKKNQSLMLFQEFCGGNGCPEDMYGIFDPQKQKILIKPADWPNGNYKQVEELLGYPISSLVEDKKAFCCNKTQY